MVMQNALDALALALVEHGQIWTDNERQLYECATSFSSRMDSDLSALVKHLHLALSHKRNFQSGRVSTQ